MHLKLYEYQHTKNKTELILVMVSKISLTQGNFRYCKQIKKPGKLLATAGILKPKTPTTTLHRVRFRIKIRIGIQIDVETSIRYENL